MDNLLDNNWLVPVLLAAGAMVLLLDGVSSLLFLPSRLPLAICLALNALPLLLRDIQAAFLLKVNDGKRPISYDSASPEAKSMVESSHASER